MTGAEATASRQLRWRFVLYPLIGILLLVLLLYLLQDISAPFIFSLILAYALDPLVCWFERRGLSRLLGVCAVFLLLLAFLLFVGGYLVPQVISEIGTLMSDIPEYWKALRDWVEQRWQVWQLAEHLNRLRETRPELVEKVTGKASEVVEASFAPFLRFTRGAFSGLLGLISAIVGALLIPVFLYYLLKDFAALRRWFREIIPPASRETALRLLGELDASLSSFIRGQLAVCLILAFLYGIGFPLVGVPAGLVIGLLAGVTSIVPFLGTMLGLILALLLSLMKYGLTWQLAAVIGVVSVVQALESNVITPRIVGRSVGLHPVIVILAILAGGRYFGLVGILLAVPVTAVLKVLASEAHRRYLASSYYCNVTTEPAGPAAGPPGPATPP